VRWGRAGLAKGSRPGVEGGELEEFLETVDIDHVGVDGEGAGLVEPVVSVATGEAEEGIDPSHPGPGQGHLEELRGEAADRLAVLGGLSGQEIHVPQGVGGLVGGKVGGVGLALSRTHPGMGLH